MTGTAVRADMEFPWESRRSYNTGDRVTTNAFGKLRVWRCKKPHSSSLAKNPLRKAGDEFWEQAA